MTTEVTTAGLATAWSDPRNAEAVAEEGVVDIRPLMSCFPTGVAVITAFGEDGGPHGMTCSSLCSVTLDPPTLLVCLRRGSATLKAVLFQRRFSVNLLADQAQPAAELFSSAVDRFEHVRWNTAAAFGGGPHLIDDAHLVADCQVAGVRPVGTHDVVFGRVIRITRLQASRPLLYGMRRYASWAACA
jgi:flavin reductase (DIM6/NTAB) family NADH-FMN oxidoreductase RutF